MNSGRATGWLVPAALFAFGLLLRVLFLFATSDSSWAYGIGYKGDAVLWWQYAGAISAGTPANFELGLPLRPPGNAWLLAGIHWLFGTGMLASRLCYATLGACLAPALYLVLRRSFGAGIAGVAAGLCAASSSLMLCANSIAAETPYLLISILSLWKIQELRATPGLGHVAIWSLAQGLACLLRAEHLGFVILMLVWLAPAWIRQGRLPASLLTAGLVFAATLAPWQITIAARIDAFNDPHAVTLPSPEIPWSSAAQRALMQLPGFCRTSAQGFVTACVIQRGGSRVAIADLDILEQAYGYRPEKLTRFPFVALYGPLNFYLANNVDADPGFSAAALQRAPILTGGSARYDADWLRNLPLDGRLALEYPPHLQLINQGLALGLHWIGEHPSAYLGLVRQRLTRFWAGAAHGFGGYAQPLGLSGRRDPVDLLRTAGMGQVIYAWLFLLVACLGAMSLRRRPELWPMLLWILSKVVVAVTFFGYARQGALIVPAVGLLLAVAWQDRLRLRLAERVRGRLARAGAVLCLWLLVSEVWRLCSPPEVWIDGVRVESVDPWPVAVHRVRAIEFR